MIKHTEGEWVLKNPDILDQGVDKTYFYITAGQGFFDKEKDEGFHVSGYLHRGDAVLLANAKRMYDMLTQVSEIMNERQLDEAMELVSKLLEEMRLQSEKLE